MRSTASKAISGATGFDGAQVDLGPMQIRTFIASVKLS